VRELQASSAAIHNPAVEAIAAWAGVSAKARQAMKRSSPSHVAAIEAPILAFLQEVRRWGFCRRGRAWLLPLGSQCSAGQGRAGQCRAGGCVMLLF